MTIADINELKNRFKVGECTIKQIAGAYVDSDKNIVTSFNKPFQSLETTEYHKYLDIVKSIYSSKVDDNVMTLEFYNGNVNARDNLDALIANELKDVAAVQLFFESIVNKLNYVGNYLILLFFDQYDVIKHAKDGKSLDESEETYSYIQCIICPVELEKGGLQYKKNENDIGAIDRDWIIKKPRIGFVYPAFEDRSADINKVMYFTSDAKDTMQEVISEILKCHMKFTITQTRERFKELFFRATTSEEYAKEYLQKVNVELWNLIEQGRADDRLTSDDLMGILQVIGTSKIFPNFVKTQYEKLCRYPRIGTLFDKKMLEQYSAQIQKDKGKVLLQKALKILNEYGHSSIGGEIEKYLESTR